MGTGGIGEVFQPAVLGDGNVGIVHNNVAKMSGWARRKLTSPAQKFWQRRAGFLTPRGRDRGRARGRARSSRPPRPLGLVVQLERSAPTTRRSSSPAIAGPAWSTST
jgi:hypothetical protein